LEFKSLDVKDFDKFKNILSSGNYCNSESSLTNMYIWQHYYNARYCVIDDVIYTIFDSKKDGVQAFMPYGSCRNTTQCVDKIYDYFTNVLKKELVINLATEDFLEFLKNSGKYNISYTEMPNSFDYVYNTIDLIELKGRKYHSKKNNYNSFAKKYDFAYKKFSSDMKDDCINFCRKVVKEHSQGNETLYKSEMTSIKKAFDSYDELGLICSTILVDEKIVALGVGERLNNEYAVIHIEKADYDYRDAYPVINRLMLKNEFSDTKFVNREEDLGIPGLIKAKKSYLPCKMINKYRIEISQ